MADESVIRCVSDTALWTAAIRANEGNLRNPAFRDTLAGDLAGERGRKIHRSFSRSRSIAWGVVVRTSAIDRLVQEAIQAGVDTVVNLGAGMDTRPYRLDLPASLRWIELDYPEIIAAKDLKLREHRPACHLRRLVIDLKDGPLRREFFAECGSAAMKSLVIAEGVIPYLPNATVAALAQELFAIASNAFWILDFDNAGKRRLPKEWQRNLAHAPFLFQEDDWLAFLNQAGWRTRRIVTTIQESEQLHRPYPFDFPYNFILRALPSKMRKAILGLSGAALLAR